LTTGKVAEDFKEKTFVNNISFEFKGWKNQAGAICKHINA